MAIVLDKNTGVPVIAGALVGIVVWILSASLLDISWFVGLLFGLIFAGLTIYPLLLLTESFSSIIRTSFYGALFAGPPFAVIFGLVGGLINAFIGLAFGGLVGFLMGRLFYYAFLQKDELDPEQLRIDELLENARAAQKEERYEDAVKMFKAVVSSEKDKSPERTAFYIANIYDDHLFNIAQARYWYRKTIGYVNREVTNQENLFIKESRKGLEGLKELEEKKKLDVIDLLNEAKAFIEDEEFEKGEAALNDLGKLYPDNGEVDYLYGHFHYHRNNPWMAVEMFKRALEKDPDNVLAAYFQAKVLDEVDRILDAIDAYKHYIELAGNDAVEADRVAEARENILDLKKRAKYATVETFKD